MKSARFESFAGVIDSVLCAVSSRWDWKVLLGLLCSCQTVALHRGRAWSLYTGVGHVLLYYCLARSRASAVAIAPSPTSPLRRGGSSFQGMFWTTKRVGQRGGWTMSVLVNEGWIRG